MTVRFPLLIYKNALDAESMFEGKGLSEVVQQGDQSIASMERSKSRKEIVFTHASNTQ